MDETAPTAVSEAQRAAGKPKVFISYSRRDAEKFADELIEALELYAGFEVMVDRHSIVEGEDWKKRLGVLIADADTVVFIISPGSATSDICHWEVEDALRVSKRILPVLWQAPGEAARVPAQLAALNYIRFDEGRSFMAGVKALVRALHADLDWLREHTRLLSRAHEWERAGRADNRLLTGADVQEAKQWAARRPKDAPEATPLHLSFIQASERAETARNDSLMRQNEERAELLKERERALARAEDALTAKGRLQRGIAVGTAVAVLLLAAGGWFGYRSYVDWRAVETEANRDDIRGQVVSYAAAAGEDALDVAPGHKTSPYTTAVANNLARREKSIVAALADAHNEISKLSNLKQRPYLSTSMNGQVYLARPHPTRRKLAILVAISDFDTPDLTKLEAPPYDVALVAQRLRDAGFKDNEVRVLENVDSKAIQDEISQARVRLEGPRAGLAILEHGTSVPNSLLIFYFSGIGAQVDGLNYILPRVSGPLKVTEDVKRSGMQVEPLTRDIDAIAASSIIMLDTNFHPLTPVPNSR